ncbi:MAG: hypothetical protein MUP81_00805 [Dehalococcoidia bacterium]|nr:hypothetical protein [Dehalococcoidia bacterium]
MPANPNTTAQQTQRGFLTVEVSRIHIAMAKTTFALGVIDKSAYALLASLSATPRTWFNAAVKQGLDQHVATKEFDAYRGGSVVETTGQLVITLYQDAIDVGGIDAGKFYYGVSKTAMLQNVNAVVDTGAHTAIGTIAALTNGTKYYLQFRPTNAANYVGNNSGIYYGTPNV